MISDGVVQVVIHNELVKKCPYYMINSIASTCMAKVLEGFKMQKNTPLISTIFSIYSMITRIYYKERKRDCSNDRRYILNSFFK